MDAGGAVRSIQAANVTMPEGELEELWTPMLPRAPRAHVLEVPLARVARPDPRRVHADRARASCCFGRPFVLLRFGAPEYDDQRRPRHRALADPRRRARRQARPGLPGDRRPPRRGAEPGYAQAHVEVEVANFYPRDRDRDRPLVLQADPVAHPRARHARVPALARPPRARGVRRRPLRDRTTSARRSTSATRRGRWWARWSPRSSARSRCCRRFIRSEPVSARSLVRSWRDWMRRTVPERLRMTSDSVVAPRAPS